VDNGGVNVDEAKAYAGLCADCRFARVIRSDRGSVFFQCGKSFEDARFPKYPRLPVRQCSGYERVGDSGGEDPIAYGKVKKS
jgi:hypothetical protein